jgi:hypothetical protein
MLTAWRPFGAGYDQSLDPPELDPGVVVVGPGGAPGVVVDVPDPFVVPVVCPEVSDDPDAPTPEVGLPDPPAYWFWPTSP